MDDTNLFDPVKIICQCEIIRFQNNAVVFVGRKFHSFHLGSKILSCYPEIHPVAWKCAFLSGDRVLVDGGADGMYHLLSIKDGKHIKSWKAPGNRVMRSKRFAVSPDGDVVFDYWKVKKKHYIVRIDLESLEYKTIPIDTELRVIQDIVCLSKNEVYLLQGQTDEACGKNYNISRLVSIKFTDSGYFPVRLYSWKSSSTFTAYSTDGRYVIYNNLIVYDLQKKELINLLEKTDVPSLLKKTFTRLYYDRTLEILQLCDGKYNEFIDCKNKKLIARYITPKNGFTGCLIENTFWIPNESGITIKPFPVIETML